MDYGTTVITDLSFEDAVACTREALQEQGFGVLTEINVQATLKNKLDQDMEQYLILGACNPQLAYQALEIERDIRLLLPCNVVVRRSSPVTPATPAQTRARCASSESPGASGARLPARPGSCRGWRIEPWAFWAVWRRSRHLYRRGHLLLRNTPASTALDIRTPP